MEFLLHNYTFTACAILFVVTAFAKSYGTIYGGGSFVVQPLLMSMGIPPQVAVANDMLGSIGATLTVGMMFRKVKEVRLEVIRRWVLLATVGTFLGVALLTILPTLVLKSILLSICVLGVLGMVLPLPDMVTAQAESRFRGLLRKLSAFQLGAYMGFSGAGATTISVVYMRRFEGLTFKQAVGTSKFLFLIPSLVAVAQYAYMGWIVLDLALLMLVACTLGGWAGGWAALKLPEKVLKTTFFIAAILVFALAGYDLWKTLHA